MSTIAQELDKQLEKLDPETARRVEQLVRDALALASAQDRSGDTWPEGYFAETSGALAGERFERPEQGELANSISKTSGNGLAARYECVDFLPQNPNRA